MCKVTPVIIHGVVSPEEWRVSTPFLGGGARTPRDGHTHQPPEVHFVDWSVKVDFACRVTGEINVYGSIELVDFGWLVDRVAWSVCAVSFPALAAEDDRRTRNSIS